MIVVSDIFGKTFALERLCRAIGDDVYIIDPYAGKYMDFQNEGQAYEFFMENMGLNSYCDLLNTRLEKIQSPVILIGFSVGASAIWQISGSLSIEKVNRAVCFYGSQVRHMLKVNPSIEIEFLLPMYEPGFSVDGLESHLSDKKNVVLHRTPYLHGFMNELSMNYNKQACTRYIDWLCHSAG